MNLWLLTSEEEEIRGSEGDGAVGDKITPA